MVAKVNGELWDLERPLLEDCSLELLTFDSEEARAVSSKLRGGGTQGVWGLLRLRIGIAAPDKHGVHTWEECTQKSIRVFR